MLVETTDAGVHAAEERLMVNLLQPSSAASSGSMLAALGSRTPIRAPWWWQAFGGDGGMSSAGLPSKKPTGLR